MGFPERKSTSSNAIYNRCLMKAQVLTLSTAVLLVVCAGCVRRDGRNTDCVWPGEAGATVLDPSRPATSRHLSADLEFAEELADRYTNVHYGPHSGYSGPPVAGKMRATCFVKLADEIGKQHGVSRELLVAAFGKNRGWIDAAEIVPFVLLLVAVAALVARKLWARYPPSEGWAAGTVVMAVCSIGFGVAAVLIGQQWTTLAENLRIGTGHLGPRVDGLPMVRYAGWVFASGVALFGLVAVVLTPRRRGDAEEGTSTAEPRG